MNLQLFQILSLWLKEAGYRFDNEKFETSLLSHPDYGRLTSITDILQEFNIENTAASIPFTHIENLTEPYIAYIKQGHEEQFALVHPLHNNSCKLVLGNNNVVSVTKNELEKIWTGTIVAIEKNTEKSKIGLTPYLSSTVFIAVALIVLLLFLINGNSFFSLLYFVFSLLGLFIAGLIVNHQLGYKNNITSKFCSLNKNSDCDSVLNSKAAKLTDKIGLSDIGVIYFSSQILILLLTPAFTQAIFLLLFLISLIGIPFIAYSIYLQKFVIKKWCPLCLGVISILLLQAIVAIFAFQGIEGITAKSIALATIIICLVILLWTLLLPLLKRVKSTKALAIEALSFRRNYHLLFPYLQNQKSIPTNCDFKTLQIGNQNGSLTITAITNPLCNSCIDTHRLLNELLAKHNGLSFQIIFYVPLNTADPRTIIAGHFLSQKNTGLLNSLEKWYSNPNPKIHLKEFGNTISKENIEILNQHKNWCHTNSIYTTPTLIINGKRFPTFYRPTDIQYFIEELLSTSSSDVGEEVSTMVFVDNT